MELDPKELAAETKNVAIETVKAEMEAKSADFDSKLETETKTINETMETKANKSDVELVQKSIDDVREEVKNFNIIKSKPEVKNELKSWLDNNAKDVLEDKNANVSMELKNESTYTPSTGANSAPYADDRQSMIEFDPHQMTLAKYITARSGSGGAYRFNHSAGVTDNSGSKAKGAAFGQTTLGVSDQHVPYTTVGHILTVPREELNDTVQLEAYFREDMTGYLTDTINEQILTGAGGAAAIRGITHWSAAKSAAAFETTYGSLADSYGTAANNIDVINATVAALKGDNFMGQKYCFVNPDLIAQIQGLKATDGHYQLSSAVDPTGKVRSFIGGVELVENSAVTSGSFYMFDTSALKWITREGMKAEMGYTGDDWQRNNVSLKVYGRYALVSGKPNGIVNGTFTNAIAALNA